MGVGVALPPGLTGFSMEDIPEEDLAAVPDLSGEALPLPAPNALVAGFAPVLGEVETVAELDAPVGGCALASAVGVLGAAVLGVAVEVIWAVWSPLARVLR